MKISEIITFLIVINYISCGAIITNLNKCSDSDFSFILTGKTTEELYSNAVTVRLLSASNVEIECPIRHKINLEKTKIFFGCKNEENQSLNDVELDIIILCTYESVLRDIIVTEVKGLGQGYYIIVDISNLVQMTNSITCSTFIGDRVNEENLEIIIKVNEGICSDSYIYIRRVM